MEQDQLNADSFSPDILEFLRLLHSHQVRYLIVGGQAVIYHGYARLTGDIDIFYSIEMNNVLALFYCLTEFWDQNIPGIQSPDELAVPGRVTQFGVPPNRIDLITQIDGVEFDDAWSGRIIVPIAHVKEPFPINIIGLKELIKNKSTSRRSKDLDDLQYLSEKLE